MPRKAFNDDFAIAKLTEHRHITDMVRGADGEFSFLFSQTHPVKITVLIPEVADYPISHECFVFADDDAPVSIAQALQKLPTLSGKPISQLLTILVRHLNSTPTGTIDDPVELDSDGDTAMPDSEAGSDAEHAAENWLSDGDGEEHDSMARSTLHISPAVSNSDGMNHTPRVSSARADLRTAKAAGFKVSQLSITQHLTKCFVSVSCRMALLGISEEAMQAWGIKPAQYLILMISYGSGYKTLAELKALGPSTRKNCLQLRVGVSDTYKCRNFEEARGFFRIIGKSNDNPEVGSNKQPERSNPFAGGIRDTFISRPLNDLMNERLLPLLQIRLSKAFSWDAAELFYHETLGKVSFKSESNATPTSAEKNTQSLADLVVSDHLQSIQHEGDLSFPLIAMQFLLRHFVRCTEFCLVCHCRLESSIEAIKPYVCDRPLCLYQYMSLGFGPSLEAEILTQPYVVDLLISFCYSAAICDNLDDFPNGLTFNVPNPQLPINGWPHFIVHRSLGNPVLKDITTPSGPADAVSTSPLPPVSGIGPVFEAQYSCEHRQILFNQSLRQSPAKRGDWLVINTQNERISHHCRVLDTSLFPTVDISSPLKIELEKDKQSTTLATWQKVSIHLYDQNFDTLEKRGKCQAIVFLLNLMPSVSQMVDYLRDSPGQSLGSWVDQIAPATLGLLRWIIASNRSCIMQVDHSDNENTDAANTKSEARVQGMPSYMQFRFAMGSPDKEQRFVDSVNSVSSRKSYPTLFAWHGSPLQNWHSIIREGLHFKKISHGRASGDGCYHSKNFTTSASYTIGRSTPSASLQSFWPQSSIRIDTAIALNEIVNATDQFRSCQPHYVVAQLDWIQTRYLFVKGTGQIKIVPEISLTNPLLQDDTLAPRGPGGLAIVLPSSAISKSRRPMLENSKPDSTLTPAQPSKSSAATVETNSDITLTIEDDTASVTTDVEDVEFLGDERTGRSAIALTDNLTAFSTDPVLNLPVLPPPSYATLAATRTVQREFSTLLKVQEHHQSHGILAQLGWYVDSSHVTRTDNIYQWVVSLHSFPLDLPLGKDMQESKVESILLEVRFPATYPHSPPFIRVIRPRFVPFTQGGGGHVTGGGSICMELLTNSGWSAVSSMESVLLQVRLAIMNVEPRPARLERAMHKHQVERSDYGIGEAIEAYKRACRAHGWDFPKDLDATGIN